MSLYQTHKTYCKISTNLQKSLIEMNEYAAAEKVGACGSYFVMECPDCGEREHAKISCGHKLCGRCAGLMRWRKINDIWPLVKTWARPRFLTLTFKSKHRLTAAWIKKQKECMRLFFREPYIKERITGWVWAWEVTYNQRLKMWHPHFHIIFDGKWIDDEVVASIWHAITGDSYIIDVREVKQNGARTDRPPTDEEKFAAVRETMKYITKAIDFTDDVNLIKEFLAATNRMRRWGLGGSAYKYKPPKPDPKDKRYWRIEMNGGSFAKIQCRECGYENFAEFWNRVPGLFDRKIANALCEVQGTGKWKPPDNKPKWLKELLTEVEENANRQIAYAACPF